ncbi:TRAP transporter small permease [Kaarinaea lacus]
MSPVSLDKIGAVVNDIEETSIAVCLGLMTLVTFSNVIARYLFNANILWALELTVFLFAWLVLMGASYGVKKHVHIGVDVVINLLPPLAKRITAGIALIACLAFSIMLLIGSWNYWLPFATERAWLETDDIPMPEMLQFLSGWINEGERYEKLPRMIPYLALPLGMTLLTFRFLQLGWKIIRGELDIIITSHETDDLEETIKATDKKEGTG